MHFFRTVKKQVPGSKLSLMLEANNPNYSGGQGSGTICSRFTRVIELVQYNLEEEEGNDIYLTFTSKGSQSSKHNKNSGNMKMRVGCNGHG